jgi:hypothetical protein
MISKSLFQKKINKIYIAFILNFDFSNWIGGFNVIENLYVNLKKNSKIYEPVFIVKKKLLIREQNILKNYKIIQTNLFNKNNFFYYINLIKIFFFGKSSSFENFFLENNIKIISHTAYAGKNSSVKSIFWMPDFQHLEKKKYFTILSRFKRELNFRLAIKNSHAILLSSNTMFNSFKRYYNLKNLKYYINKFTFLSIKNINQNKINFIKKKYKINSNYFYVCNQYWSHKNFEVIINALKHLQIIKKNILFVSSGSSVGGKNDLYFKSINKLIIKNNLSNNFLYLGIVNKSDVEILMAGCSALVNPSTYEGRNAAVEQAKALKKQIILSNIPAHREQIKQKIFFFNIKNHIHLANILVKLIKKKIFKFNLSKKFLKKNKNLHDAYIKNYINIVDNLIKFNN